MTEIWQERTELLLKTNGLEKLKNARLLVIGLGGVGSFAAEFLVRAGTGHITIADGDLVDITNINRQLPALQSTLGKAKTEVMQQRLADINPAAAINKISRFLNPEDMEELLSEGKFDYVLDCIDSIQPKVALIKAAKKNKVKIVSCMGAGGKTDPAKVLVRDLSKTNNCKLARQIRKRLKRESNITKGIRCVFSTELQREDSLKMTDGAHFKRSFYGTVSYMPALFGLYAAAEAINHILKKSDA